MLHIRVVAFFLFTVKLQQGQVISLYREQWKKKRSYQKQMIYCCNVPHLAFQRRLLLTVLSGLLPELKQKNKTTILFNSFAVITGQRCGMNYSQHKCIF